jgi:hypothetical protein
VSTPQPDLILQTGLAFWPSKTLLSAIEMEVFTELAKKPEDFETLSGRLGLHQRGARDFLDALVALGFLERHNSLYSNTPSTDLFLDKKKPSYIGGILEMANHRLYGFWGNLTAALRTGQPQNEASRGEPDPFAILYADPERLKQFLRAMTGISHGANLTIAATFPWANYKTAVDVGTAQGDLITQVLRANAHLSGIGFDLPEVAPIFEDYAATNGLIGRVKFQPGSFFTDPLPKADVVMMGHILHDWDLEQKKMLIAKAYAALPEGGNTGRFRLHRSRLHRMDEGRRLPRNQSPASGRPGFNGDRNQIRWGAGNPACEPAFQPVQPPKAACYVPVRNCIQPSNSNPIAITIRTTTPQSEAPRISFTIASSKKPIPIVTYHQPQYFD